MAEQSGTVISVHSLEQWSLLIEDANKNNKLVVIDFTATWCGPCRHMAPVFAELAKKHLEVLFVKVDVDEMKDITAQFGVEAMPTFLYLKEGKEVDRVVGAKREEVASTVVKHLGTPSQTATA